MRRASQNYDPVQDRKAFEDEVRRLSHLPEARDELARMHVVEPEVFQRLSAQSLAEHRA